MKHWMWVLGAGAAVTLVLKHVGKSFWKWTGVATLVIAGLLFWKGK